MMRGSRARGAQRKTGTDGERPTQESTARWCELHQRARVERRCE